MFTSKVKLVVVILSGLFVASGLASTARADVVADWALSGTGSTFFADSSGNGHTLSLNAGTVTQAGDAASFSGTGGVLSANIDLSPYRQVTISWTQTGGAGRNRVRGQPQLQLQYGLLHQHRWLRSFGLRNASG